MEDWTPTEIDLLRARIEALVPLSEVARELERPYSQTATKACELGVRANRPKLRKVPRGAGYDKQSVKRHVVALWKFTGTIPQYARAHSLKPEPLITAFKKHFPEAWADYVQLRGEPESRVCHYCKEPFYPANANQQFCDAKCSADFRQDQAYFGGRRRNTIGLEAGRCQLCGREADKGISSHHVFGKNNDPDNEVLVALCRGCHGLVTTLAQRRFVDDPAAWEALISLVWLRRHGATTGDTVGVHVDLDTQPALRQAA